MRDGGADRRGTYGAAPVDSHHPGPYLYVSPWAGRIDGFFDDPTFKGASLLRERLVDDPDPTGTALGFLREARDRIRRRV